VKIRRLGALIGALALVLSVAGVASANAPDVASVDATATVVGHDVTLTGTWDWDVCDAGNTKKFVGLAVAWGDLSSGAAVFGATNTYYVGDTPVAVDADPCTSTPGNFSATHTFALDATYTICPIVYDIEAEADPGTKHSTTAGGADATDHNTDNSVEENGQEPTVANLGCVSVVIAPATSTDAAPASNDNGTLPLILLIVGLIAAVAVIRPLSRRSR
jgi:hypothetical protein